MSRLSRKDLKKKKKNSSLLIFFTKNEGFNTNFLFFAATFNY